MLEGVNKINWKSLGNPNIPRWLEGLTSADESIRSKAIHRIAVDVVMEDEIDHGNMRPTSALSSEIPVRIIPFLFELLKSTAIPSRISIICFLDGLANYHVRFKDAEGQFGLTKEHLTRAAKMHELICAETKIYRRLLSDKDSEVRMYTDGLLMTLGLSHLQRY